MLIRCIDLETGGINTETEKHGVCEVGACDITIRPADRPEIGTPWSMITRPGKPVTIEARAIHHITDSEMEGAPPPTSAFMRLTGAAEGYSSAKPDLYVAHMADADREYFSGGETPWICSWKAALRVFPDAPSHKLQVLRYYLELDLPPSLALPAHRAGPDAFVLAHIFAHILEAGTPVEDMIRWSKGAALMPRFPIGEHRGKKWDEVPDKFLQWMLSPDRSFDRDTLANVRHHIKKRALAEQARRDAEAAARREAAAAETPNEKVAG